MPQKLDQTGARFLQPAPKSHFCLLLVQSKTP
jgi:hypothetical protein